MNQKVTPWEVSGKVDYDKLIKEFGTTQITDELLEKIEILAGPLHLFLRRGLFFSHRDIDLILKDYESGKGFFLYTGRAPGGEMHIAHMIPFLLCKWMQDAFKINLYIQIPDEEKFLFKSNIDYENLQEKIENDILNIAALNFDTERTFLFRNTEYIRHMYPSALKIAKKTTFSTARAVFGFENDANIGMIFYPALQIVPTFFEKKRCLIPCGIDQDNYWRIQHDIAESLGYYKTAAIHNKFLPPLTGVEGKMSSSISETAIYLSDNEKTVKKKIMKYAFSGGQVSIDEHRRLGGNPEIDVAYQWLSFLFEEDDNRLKQIYDNYKGGQLLTGEIKQILVDKINLFLCDHRKNKECARPLLEKYMYTGRLAREMWTKNCY